MPIPPASFPAPDADPPPARNRPPDADGIDLEVDFLQIVKQSRQAKGAGMAAAAGNATPASRAAQGNRAPMERKPGEGAKAFGRFVTRPGASMAASSAADRPAMERPLSANLPVPGASAAKFHGKEDVAYSPNRLQTVINEACQDSTITWLDQLGKANPVIISLLIAGVLGGLGWTFRNELRRHQGSDGAVSPPLSAALPSDATRQAAIRRTFDRFLAAPDVTGKLQWVLEPARVEARMKDFYIVRMEQDPRITSYEVSPPVRAAGAWWFTLTCQAPDGPPCAVLMKETPSGGQLDWENFVAYGSMPWEKFHTTRPALPQSIRARIRASPRFEGKYSAEHYLAYEIAHRSGLPILYGYAARASRTGQLLAALSPGETWQSANLYLSWEPDPGTPDSMLIVDLIRNNWLDTSITTPATGPSAKAVSP